MDAVRHQVQLDIVELLKCAVVAGLRAGYRVGQGRRGDAAHGWQLMLMGCGYHQHHAHALAECGLRGRVEVGRRIAQAASEGQQVMATFGGLQPLPAVAQGFVLRFVAKRPILQPW
ncbi:hypothetical protein D3C81_1367950 [compost metagenome]